MWWCSDIEVGDSSGKRSRRSRGIHKLTDYMNCIGNIRASDSEIDLTPNKLFVESSIR